MVSLHVFAVGLLFMGVSSRNDEGLPEAEGMNGGLLTLAVLDFVPMWAHRIRASDLHSLSIDPFGGGCLVLPRGTPVGDTLGRFCQAVFSMEANQADCVQHVARTIHWDGLLGEVVGFSLDIPDGLAWDYVLRVSIEIRFSFRGISGTIHCREGGLLSHAIDRYCTSLNDSRGAPLDCEHMNKCHETLFRWWESQIESGQVPANASRALTARMFHDDGVYISGGNGLGTRSFW
jgi:hypothetical protein